ncbi:MAG: amino acid ABC transporter permease [Oscillospiraceae bacterium]|nr:amino acid ABC transporter permease [Oscillospiraceae bacterium]
MADIGRQIYTAFIEADRYMLYLNGLKATLQLSLGGVFIGLSLGLLLALMRLTKARPLSALSGAYIDIIRGTPMVVQLLVFYFVIFGSVRSTSPNFKVMVGAIAFGCNSAAYVAEIIRAGILSIDSGQAEAGRSLGLSGAQCMRFIVLPQAVKNVIPALGNELITLIKETSIFGYIGGVDLAKAGEQIRTKTFIPFVPLFGVALIYYLVVKALTYLLRLLERRLRAGDNR